LQAQINFVDDEGAGHSRSLAAGRKNEMSLRDADWLFRRDGLFFPKSIQKPK